MSAFRSFAAAAAALLLTTSVMAADRKPAAPAFDLTIYHIEGRRSERIVWLCEELGCVQVGIQARRHRGFDAIFAA